MTAMGRLVIHIGMHKTGSTSIQRFLSRNRRLLPAFGVTYPVAHGPDGKRLPKHNDLFHAISHEKDHDGIPHPHYGPSATRVENIAAWLGQKRGVTILSAEGFSGEDPAFAEALEPLGRVATSRIVVFLRRQDDWVEAFYRQMVMNDDVAEKRAFEAFLGDHSTRAHLDYETILGWWAKAFGQKAIHILPYQANTRVVPAFLVEAGLSPLLAKLPYAQGQENPTPGATSIQALRQARISGDEEVTLQFRKQCLDASGGFQSALSTRQRADIMTDYHDMNARIARRYLDRDTLFDEVEGR